MMALWLALGCTGSKDPVDSSSDTPTEDREIVEGLPSFYETRPKNVLMISMDTFRRDYMSRYGGAPVNTPYLNQLAAEGYAMDTHRSCSNWTHAGSFCVMNGMDHFDYGYPPWLANDLPTLGKRPTFASTFTDLGYHTILISSNSWLTRHNLQYGYTFSETPEASRADKVWESARTQLFEMQVANASELDKPWLVHIHVKEPHIAYKPPDSYLADLDGLPEIDFDFTDADIHYEVTRSEWYDMSEEEKDLINQHMLIRYRGEMQYMDDMLKDIIADADDFGLLDDTLLVFWTDHGEQFWEHGDQSHAYSLYTEENDAIFFMWSRNIVSGRWQAQTTHIDILPTVLEALGHDTPEYFTGLPVGQADRDRPVYSSVIARNGTLMSMTQGHNRLIYHWDGDKELYHLGNDPLELTNLYDAEDPTVIEMWDLFAPKIKQFELGAGKDQGSPRDVGP